MKIWLHNEHPKYSHNYITQFTRFNIDLIIRFNLVPVKDADKFYRNSKV